MSAYVPLELTRPSEMYSNTTFPDLTPASASFPPMDLLPLYFPTEDVSSSPPSASPSSLLLASGDKCLDNDTQGLNDSSSPVAVAPPPLKPLVSPLVAAYLIFVVVVSVVANALVVVVRACGRRRRLRSSHVCTLSLAVSDVAFSLLVHTLMILAALGVDPMLLFNEPGCNYYGFCAMFFGTFSMCIHASVSIIRYVNICHPERVEWLKVKYVYSLISFSAVYSAIWALGPLLQWGRYETFEFGCTLAFSDPTQSSKSFVTCAFIFVLLLPLAIVVVCYSLIVLQAHKFKREMNRIKCTGKVLASIPAAGERKESTVDSLRKTQRSFRLHNRLVRISMVVAAGYVFGWLPYALVCMWAAYGDYNNIPVEIRVGASLICKSTTAYNPFIYYFMSEGFRADLRYLGRRTGFTSRAPSINTGQASYLSSTRSSVRKWRDRPRENSCLLASRRENTSCTLETVATPGSILPSPDTTDEPLVDHTTIARRTSSCLPLSTSSLQQQYATVERRLRTPLSSAVLLSNHELMNNGLGRALRYGTKFPCRRSVSFSAAAVTEESCSGDNSTPVTVLSDRRGVKAFRSMSFYEFRDQRKLTATQLDRLSKRCLYMNTRV
ncbi:opsin-3-like [Portunus trituberculatus]|uniref:opsin-3-like n=1 Tax=Portunus trituberculatus TaxID=210409 RepID=UPI001E1CE534|nr:opsin-3-like [Portunus trituberculatus]